MAIVEPVDLLADFPGTTTRFNLDRVEELDATRSGAVISKDLGPALWALSAQTRELPPTVFRAWKARLNSLEGGARVFKGYDLTACYPAAYPRGSWPTGPAFDGYASLNAVSDARTIRLAGLPADFVVSVGDYLAFDYGASGARALHQAVESVAAAGSGITPEFEIQPPLRTGWELDAVVALVRPHTLMTLVPGSVSDSTGLNGRGSISFSARQTIP